MTLGNDVVSLNDQKLQALLLFMLYYANLELASTYPWTGVVLFSIHDLMML